MLDVSAVRARLPKHRIDWFETLDSTMTEARRDLTPGRVVGAETQTAGVGRHGRAWHSAAGEGLWVTLVLGVKPAPVLTLALGLAAREAMTTKADLRWPNDVLIGGRKCAGILTQAEGGVVLAGIGINVSQDRFPEGLDTPATSLRMEGIGTSREDLLVALVEAVDRHVALPQEEIVRRFSNASTYVSGKRVTVEGIEGVTCGLDPAGFLRVRDDNGTERAILAGGVRPV